MKEEKLKEVIREEIEKVTKLLIDGVNRPISVAIAKTWLQSLQRIDGVCKERNRY